MAATVTVDFNANLARFSSQIDKGVAELNRFQSNADRMAKTVGTAFTALGAGVIGGAIVAFGKNVLDAADRLQDLSDRTDVAVKDLASLNLVAKLADTDLESVGQAIARLNLSFSQAQGGSKEIAAALARLGVTSTDAKERFFQLADAYERAGGQGRVLDDIQQVLGKSYVELIPLIKQGGDALRDAARESESFAESMARLSPEAGKFNDELDKLKQNAADFAAHVLPPLVSGFNLLIEKLRGGTGNDPFDDYLTWLGEATRRQENLNHVQAKFGKGSLEYITAANALQVALDKLKQYQNAAASAQKAAANPAPLPAVDPARAIQPARQSSASLKDPLANILSATDIERTREYNSLLDLLNGRFDNGRKNAELYQQALDELNKRFGVNQALIDVFGNGSFKTASAEVADMIRKQTEDFNSLNAIVPETTQRLQEMIAAADFSKLIRDQEDMVILADAFNKGLLSESEYLDVVKNRLGLVGQAANQNVPIFQQFGMVIVNNLENAISSGDGFSSVLDVLGKQLENLIIQLTIVEPLTKGIKGMLDGGGSSGGDIFGSILGWIFSANGNAFSGGRVQAFANGGVLGPLGGLLTRPTVFPMANGGIGIGGEAGTEAVMPLQRMKNGKLGVMAANDGPSVQVIINNNASGTQATASERTDQNGNRFIEVIIDQIDQKLAGNMVQGRGALTNAVQATYALNRSAGSY